MLGWLAIIFSYMVVLSFGAISSSFDKNGDHRFAFVLVVHTGVCFFIGKLCNKNKEN